MDYGKFKYEQSQKAKESRKKATHILVKEMKYRPKLVQEISKVKRDKLKNFSQRKQSQSHDYVPR